MSAPLLATKLYLPPARPNRVPRPRLIARLNQNHPLTLIAAPAGFGKTTLVSDWIPKSEHCITWVSLDDGDNDPTCFWAYVIAALQRLRADWAESALALLRSPQPPPLMSVLTTLINEIADFPENFALVLDDYHLITTQSLHEALVFLLNHLPPQMGVVITTRADPPLPLARWRARNQLSEIRADDLRSRMVTRSKCTARARAVSSPATLPPITTASAPVGAHVICVEKLFITPYLPSW